MGKKVLIPFELGSTLYDISEVLYNQGESDILELDASEFSARVVDNNLLFSVEGVDFLDSDFGKYIFSSKEKALKELERRGVVYNG